MQKHNIIYWVSTGLLCLAMFGGALGQLFRAKANVEVFEHLGFPIYFMTILGTWKILGVIAILLPGYPRIKEWAYAGFFFAMSGASVAHLVKNDGFAFIIPIIVSILIFLSWYYRPLSKKIHTI